MKVNDKVFVITGAGGGIGSDLALTLLEKSAKVFALDVRGQGLEELKSKCNGSKNLHTHKIDITDKDAVYKTPELAERAFGQIDGVINNAGIIQPFVKVIDLDYETIERLMKVNFYGTLYMTKAFLPHLLSRPEAHIVNISSMGGFLPVPGQSVYGASKAAVKLMTEGLYAELLYTNVHVSVVFPGATKTNISSNSGVKTPSGANTKDLQKAPMLSSKQVAQIIIKGIEKNKPMIFTGRDSKTMNLLYRLAPTYATKLITKKMSALLG